MWQARIPEPNGERVISQYTLREQLNKLGELIGEYRRQSDGGQDWRNFCTPRCL